MLKRLDCFVIGGIKYDVILESNESNVQYYIVRRADFFVVQRCRTYEEVMNTVDLMVQEFDAMMEDILNAVEKE